MTDPTPPKGFEVTIDCSVVGRQSTDRTSSTDVSRAKVAFVEGTKPRLADETATLLRQRLKAVAVVLSLTAIAAFVRGFFLPEVPLIVLRTVVLVVVIGSFVLLHSPVRLSLGMLRLVELAVFGAMAVQVVSGLSQRTLAFAQSGDVASTVAGKQMIFFAWTTLILLYGMFMPNTWKRAAVVLFPAACIPYATVLFLRWHSDDVAAIFDADRFGLPVPMPLLAAFAGVYASHIIHSIRLEAFRARQFGQYRLKEKLGSGGMGEVYEAEHVLLKRPCAIKLIRPGSAADATALARFEREVRATAKLTHWNTIDIYDYGHTEDGTFYYVMELLPGLSLEELVGRHGPLPPERAVHFLRQACRALGEAHAAGLIHRDIKPANIFAAKRGGVYDVAKLLDFGLVRQQAEEEPADAHLTQAGSFGGSPFYMSPEQATEFSKADARTDIYSLGAVAYYLLTGRPPFSGKSPIEIIIAHSRDEVVPPGKVRDGIPADLEQVVLRCLAKDPDERFPDVGALEKALGACECADRWDDQRAADWWQQVKSA
jgi:tRNA A-37 threonylcarbamoyl transferase component Bud32